MMSTVSPSLDSKSHDALGRTGPRASSNELSVADFVAFVFGARRQIALVEMLGGLGVFPVVRMRLLGRGQDIVEIGFIMGITHERCVPTTETIQTCGRADPPTVSAIRPGLGAGLRPFGSRRAAAPAAAQVNGILWRRGVRSGLRVSTLGTLSRRPGRQLP